MDKYDLDRKFEEMETRIKKLENDIKILVYVIRYKDEIDKLRFVNKK